MDTIEIRVSWDRLREHVPIDDRIEFETGSLIHVRNLLSYFVVNGTGDYMPFEKAVKKVGQLPETQLLELRVEFIRLLSESAVPNANGAA